MARIFGRVAWMVIGCSACNTLAGIDVPHDRPDGAPAAPRDGSAPSEERRDTAPAVDATVDDASDSDAREPPCTGWVDCGEGRYCDELGACRSCGDITSVDDSHVEFAPPEPLRAINDNATTDALRMPRSAAEGPGLMYVRFFFDSRIWATQNFAQNAGGPMGSPVDETDVTESGPLAPAFAAQGQLAGHDFFFDRSVAKADNRRELFGATLDANGAVSKVTRLPAPFNAPTPTGQWSSSFALARDRAWWMVNLDGGLNTYLMTAPLAAGAKSAVVSINLPPGCPLREIDAVPWATPDGAMLLVSAMQRDATCNAPDSRTDVFLVRLDASGQPLSAGVSLDDVDLATSSETDASFSNDLCWLYFASDRSDGHFRLFRSHRGR